MTAGPARLMLWTLSAATFLATGSTPSTAPFLLHMARDLNTDLAAVGSLVAMSATTWGAASLAAGIASDRLGRRPLVAAGLLVLGVSRLGLGMAGSYTTALLWQVLAGAGGGAYTGTVFAAVSDHFPSEQRGRALGTVITGQSLSLVLAVPIVTLVGSAVGWRGAMAAHAGTLILSALAAFATVPGLASRDRAGREPPPRLVSMLRPRLLALLGSSTMERTCFAGVTVYLATYLVASYDISLVALAPTLALVAVGNLLGNLAGGRLADRCTERLLVFAASSAATGLLALPLLGTQPGLLVSVAAGFGYSLTNAVGRPALLAALSDVPSDVRGSVLGLNITVSSVGWLSATAFGGWLIARFGFGALGAFTAAAGLLGSLLAVVSVAASRRAGGR